jgi:hypothetical protein
VTAASFVSGSKGGRCPWNAGVQRPSESRPERGSGVRLASATVALSVEVEVEAGVVERPLQGDDDALDPDGIVGGDEVEELLSVPLDRS